MSPGEALDAPVGVPAEDDAEAMVCRLADTSRGVLLVGVRHHSPAMSAALDPMLASFAPTRLCVELPIDYAPWIPHLTRPELVAPVALAGVRADGGSLSFYPFADFSPELAAMRWASRAGVPIEPIDLGLGAAVDGSLAGDLPGEDAADAPDAWLPALHSRLDVPSGENLWDHVVEARAQGAPHERVRRAGLLAGWALRLGAHRSGGVSPRDLARERFMRARLAEHVHRKERVAVVVGAFHAPALLEPPSLYDEATAPAAIFAEPGAFVTSLIPYAFELLDARSGYPAGIRDPGFQERAYFAMRGDGETVEHEVASAIVAIAREVRAMGHLAGVPDAKEAVRMAGDLARLRGLPSPGRRELLEAVETCLGHGELLGRRRVLARACERVLVGRKRGGLAPGTPRSGLSPHVARLLDELRLPGPTKASKDPARLRLDPLRSEIDRRRHVALVRLCACGVPYARRISGEATGGVETLTELWDVRWEPATEAMLELAGVRGVTLAQAAEGAIRAEAARLDAEGARTAAATLALVESAAASGLASLTAEGLRALLGPFALEAGLPELVSAIALIERLRRGHVAGLPVDRALVCTDVELFAIPPEVDTGVLVAAAVRALEGLEGSDRVEDARAALELVRLFVDGSEQGVSLGEARLGWAIDRLASGGAPLIAGAAAGLRVLLGRGDAAELGATASAWVDAAVDADGRRALSRRLRGLLTVAAPLLEAHPAFLDALAERVERIDDASFLARVAALRDGFDGLSPAARDRLLAAISDRLGARDRAGRAMDVLIDDDPIELARYARADHAGREAASRWPSA